MNDCKGQLPLAPGGGTHTQLEMLRELLDKPIDECPFTAPAWGADDQRNCLLALHVYYKFKSG
jgi:hypothetical protein